MNHPGMISKIIDDKDKFEWSEKNILKVKSIIEKYPV